MILRGAEPLWVNETNQCAMLNHFTTNADKGMGTCEQTGHGNTWDPDTGTYFYNACDPHSDWTGDTYYSYAEFTENKFGECMWYGHDTFNP